ncbi:unnamed protein product [Protopolystoma xenopodis]|uniref:Uncharacterized protein n=1 Tax=Protopolystoma xenopodis TaxID=117903 RepID=A0A3S5B4Y6_9PLAT|nr:unnamed protein product [Protopolystoma xenopodis]
MEIFTDDAVYDAGETSGNVTRPRSDFGNDHADNGFRTRSCNLVLIMAKLPNDADYKAGETSGNVPSPLSDSGNHHGYYGLQKRCIPLGLPANMTKLRKQSLKT